MRTILLLTSLPFLFSCVKKDEPKIETPQQTAAPTTIEKPEPIKAETPEKVPVGHLSGLKLKVEVRSLDSLAWETAKENHELFNRDTIRTGENSSGIITFLDSSVLRLKENSIITITNYQKMKDLLRSTIALPKGTVQGEVSQHIPTEMTIRTQQGWIKVGGHSKNGYSKDGLKSAAQFGATVSPSGTTEFTLDSGDAILVARDIEQPIKKGERLTIKGPTHSDPNTEPNWDQLPEITDKNIKTEKTEKPEKKIAPKGKVKFKILEPEADTEINTDKVKIRGQGDKESQIIVNGNEVPINASGVFQTEVSLKPGINLVIIQVIHPITKAIDYHNLEIKRK